MTQAGIYDLSNMLLYKIYFAICIKRFIHSRCEWISWRFFFFHSLYSCCLDPKCDARDFLHDSTCFSVKVGSQYLSWYTCTCAGSLLLKTA